MRAGRSRLRQHVVELRRRHASESRRRLARDGRVEQRGSPREPGTVPRIGNPLPGSGLGAPPIPQVDPAQMLRLDCLPACLRLCVGSGHSARAEHWALRALAGAGFRNLGVRRALGKHQASKHQASTRQASTWQASTWQASTRQASTWQAPDTSKWASTGRASGQHTLSGNMSGTRLLPPPRGGRR